METDLIYILYVDDSPLDRELILDALVRQQEGFRVTVAGSRLEFEAALAQDKFDLVLSDFNILGFDGLQVLEVVHGHDPDLPVIIVTGTGSEEIAVQALKRGVAEYVIKTPSHIRRLPRTIHTVLEKVRLEKEHQLADEQIHFQASLLGQVSEAIFSTDADFIVYTWNKGAEHLYGWTAQEAIGKAFPALVPTSYPNNDREQVLQKFRSDGYWMGEVIQKHKSGKSLYILSTSTWLRDSAGNPTGTVVVNRDIAERKQAEERIRQSEEQYRLLFENHPLPMWVYDLETLRFLAVNDAAVEKYGYSRDEFLGMTLKDIRPGEEVARLVENVASQKETIQFSGPWIHNSKSGHTFFVEIFSHGLDYAGRPARLVMANDISERKKVEDEIIGVSNELKKAQSFAHIGSWSWDIQGDKVQWSDEMYRIFGIAKESFTGNLNEIIARAIYPDDRERVNQSNLSVMRERQPIPLEYRIVLPDGAIRWVWAEAGELILDAEGKPAYLNGFVQDITWRKETEFARQASELRYRNLFENSPISLWEEDFSGVKQRLDILRQAGVSDFTAYFSQHPQAILDCLSTVRVLDVNQATVRLHGAQTKAQLLGSLDAVLPLEHLQQFVVELVNIAEGKKNFSWEGRNRTLDGRQIDVSLNWSVMPGYEETLEHVIVSVIDITERNRAEETLRQHYDYLLALQETTVELLSQLDLPVLLENIVRRAGRLMNTSAGYLNLIDSETGALLPKVGLGGLAESLNFTVQPGEDLAGIVWQTRQPYIISDYDLWEGRIASYSKEKIRSLMGVPLISGTQFLGVLGLAYERDDDRLFTEQDVALLEQFSRLATIAIQNAQLYQEAQDEIVRRKRIERELRQIRDHLEELVETRTAELSIAKEQADAANRAKSDFLATMSHEIRTPLNGILGLTHLALQAEMDAKMRNYLTNIRLSGEILLATINDILDFSKIEAVKMDLEEIHFDLNEVLLVLSSTLSLRAKEKGLALLFNVPPDIPPVLVGDPLRLGQVLLNLASNAVKFTEQGEVEVQVALLEKTAQQVTLEFAVRDSGIGVAEEQMMQIFQPFSQADTSISRKYGGSGLGLVISKRLVEMMGGEITVESKLGQGARFSFTLTFPYSTGAAGEVSIKIPEDITAQPRQSGWWGAPGAEFSSLRGQCILLVEDNEINQMVAVEMLQQLGLQVSVAPNGEQALAMLNQNDYAAVLMDIQMPRMDGYQTTAHIRSDPRFTLSRLPIIAMTAHALVGEREKVLQAGMNDYIAKPVNPAQLTAMLLRWLAPEKKTEQAPKSLSSLEILPHEVLALLNAQAALARLGGNLSLYKRLLKKFAIDHAEAVAQIRSAIQANDLALAQRLAHTLKSVAATLGADALSETARQLEAALIAGEQAQFASRLDKAEQQHRQLLTALAVIQSA
ncbi:MAG: PAS domain S-box protein [Chloroflexota bacterium]